MRFYGAVRKGLEQKIWILFAGKEKTVSGQGVEDA